MRRSILLGMRLMILQLPSPSTKTCDVALKKTIPHINNPRPWYHSRLVEDWSCSKIMSPLSNMLTGAATLLWITHLSIAFPSLSATQLLRQAQNHSLQLSETPAPECFTLTFAPPLKQDQCNDELEWFLDEERKYEELNFVGADTPYTYTRPRAAGDDHGPCYITVDARDLFVTDEFTFEDLAKFTSEVLESCKDGRVRAGRGGRVMMTDARREWAGFFLRVDAWDPNANWRLNPGNIGTAQLRNQTLARAGRQPAFLSS